MVSSCEPAGKATCNQLYGTKGAVTNCPLAISYQWVRECLKSGKLLSTAAFLVKN